MGSWLMYLLQKKGLTQIINIIFGQLAENSARTQNPRQLNLSVHGRLSFFKNFFPKSYRRNWKFAYSNIRFYHSWAKNLNQKSF